MLIVNLQNKKKIPILEKEFEFWMKTLKPHVKSSVLAKINEKFGKDRRTALCRILETIIFRDFFPRLNNQAAQLFSCCFQP